MPKLILHIGTHKTGTTAIQSFLQANANALEEHGVSYPIFPVRWPERVNPNRNGYFLNRAALHRLSLDDKATDKQLAIDCVVRLARLVSENQLETVLLSDERMWYSGALRASYWNAVRGITANAGFETVEVIVYLRRQDRFAESLWNQFVKATKETCSLQEYLAEPHVRKLCDYYAGVKQLEKVFGREHVRVAVYDSGTLRNGDAVEDFCYRIGLPYSGGFTRPEDEFDNPRLNNNLVELKRIANRSVAYQQLNNVFGPSFAHAMQSDDWTERTELLGSIERAEFLARFKRGNKQLSKEYFSGKDLFKAPHQDDTPQWEFDSKAMLQDAVLVMADMMAMGEARINDLSERIEQLERLVAMSNQEASTNR